LSRRAEPPSFAAAERTTPLLDERYPLMPLRRTLIGLAVIASSIATPLVAATSANAAPTGTGTLSFVTHCQGTSHAHAGATTYTCDGAGTVSGATKAGVKRKGPAAIAKNVALIGLY
jgi:hypothetical protein